MNVLTILGSPRKDGNTAKVLGWVEEALKSQGNQVDHVHITDHAVNGCAECYTCQTKPDEPGCPQPDDALKIFERVLSADAVIYASPVFCWSWSAQIKPLIDRHVCLITDQGAGNFKSLIEGKKMALVGTCGGPLEGNGQLLIDQFKLLVDYSKARLAGHLLVPLCTTPDGLSDEVRGQAAQLATALTK
jgi:multimeric flavodoxin WrbA